MQPLFFFATLCPPPHAGHPMKVSKKRLVHPAHLSLAVVALGALLACGTETAPGNGATASDGGRLRLATTTSLYDTGLWDILESRFEDMYNVELDILTGGTGKALEFGRLGEVDVLAIHDRVREEAFIAKGYGVERHPIAYNHFLIVGPANDPASIIETWRRRRRFQRSCAGVWTVATGCGLCPGATSPGPTPGRSSSGRIPASATMK